MAYQLLSHYLYSKPIPLIGSHRGIYKGSTKTAENTLNSIFSIENINADFCEIDLMFTKDKQLILFHDATLNEDTIETSFYSKLLLARPELITLSDLISEIKVSPKLINIELKSYFLTLEKKEAFIVTLLTELNKHELTDKILISSFDIDLIKLFREKTTKYKVGYLVEHDYELNIDEDFLQKLDILCPHIDLLDYLNTYDLPNFVWESSNETKIKQVIEKILQQDNIETWIKTYNIFGLTTNNVLDIKNLLFKSK